ncbi:Phosphatidylethanolamine N-methyltransferase [Yarrowia sp. B02]|nr:Phosphatidylethanolamine N-methyltransferase [Yarrowia sp. B02]
MAVPSSAIKASGVDLRRSDSKDTHDIVDVTPDKDHVVTNETHDKSPVSDTDSVTREKKDVTEPVQYIGKCPDGTTFVVPETEDMLTNLFDPRITKSLSDIIIVSILAFFVSIFFIVPASFRVPTYLFLFAFWRLAYNGGIGWLLHNQSNYHKLTKWAVKYQVFTKQDSWWHKLLKKEFETRFANQPAYSFYDVPVEFNTWILFRHVVDLILMSDFTCYFMLAWSCALSVRTNQPWWLVIGRWCAGLLMLAFNLWAKTDAHRVVKDYAWYWGDFFFLKDMELTFDGVFEMAPHPMYSIGYAGFYAASLMACSYTLFLASLAGHAAQFVFLNIVENPHIEKTYNPHQPKQRRKASHVRNRDSVQIERTTIEDLPSSILEEDESVEVVGSIPADAKSQETVGSILEPEAAQKHSLPPLVVFNNFQITRVTDIMTVGAAAYTLLLYFLPDNSLWYTVTFVMALSARLFHTLGLGIILRRQSERRSFTKTFLKFGIYPFEAYEQWQVWYNLSTVLSYTTFGLFCLRQWRAPSTDPLWPLKYILGLLLVALHSWTSKSIYDSLGHFGWFYGDFFLDRKQSLTYSGIYRYLNNPERFFGIAGVWGLALMTNSPGVGILAFLWTLEGMAFIKFVEQPHMQRVYGTNIRHDAGVTKTVKNALKLPSPFEKRVRQFQGSVDKVINDTLTVVEEFIGLAKPTLSEVVNDSRILLRQYPAKLTLTRMLDVPDNIDTGDYGLELVGGKSAKIATPNLNASSPATPNRTTYSFGEPIHVKWKSSANRSAKDWIGLYRVHDNTSSEVTSLPSRGRWAAVDPSGHESHTDGIVTPGSTSGEVVFRGDTLFWETGVYEFRYHHAGKHTVLTTSAPFEIVAEKIDLAQHDAKSLASELLPIVQRCFSLSMEFPPEETDDYWALEEPKVVQRVQEAVQAYFGIELAQEVLLSDESVEELAGRLLRVRDALRGLTKSETKE